MKKAKNTAKEVEVIDLDLNGNGLVETPEGLISYPFTVPGDWIIPQPEESPSFKLIHVSPIRNEDRLCPAFGRCGSCKLQHIQYSQQLEYKQSLVEYHLKENGIHCRVHPVLGMKDPFRYRNKMVFSFDYQFGKIIPGLYEEESHTVVPIMDCLLHHELAEPILNAFMDYLIEYRIRIYDRKTGEGLIRHLMIKRGFTTGEIMVVVVANLEKSTIPVREELIQKLKAVSPSITSIYVNVNQGFGGMVLGEKNIKIFGKETIHDTIGDLKFEISPNSFFQVNSLQTKVLYQKALDYANLTGKETVFDLYSGVGTIALFVADYAKMVYGIESVKDALGNSRKNAEHNGIQNVQFVYGKAEYAIKKLFAKKILPEVVIMDPPRTGCEMPVLITLLKMLPSRIVYISCNPETLARDIRVLSNNYFIKEIQPVDMFPHTMHIECVALLVKK